MKPDDFESQLQRQPLRGLPAEWRREILSAAQEAVAQSEPVKPAVPVSWWRELLWPCPQAWVGLAAVWVLIAGLNLATNRGEARPKLEARREITPEERMAFIEQQQLLARLLEPETAPPPHVDKPVPPRSDIDSDRRRGAYLCLRETILA
jgi:hypothetical protein